MSYQLSMSSKHGLQQSGVMILAGLALLGVFPGCIQVTTEPIKVEPIYIEITINHRVQEALDDIFADLDQASATTDYEPLEESDLSPEE